MTEEGPTTEENWKDDDFLGFGDVDQQDDVMVCPPARQRDDDNNNDDNDGELAPPWVSGHPNRFVHPIIRLHNEIVDFCRLMEPKPHEIQERQKLVDEFITLAMTTFENKCKVQVFGSQETGLFLPTSDIDVVVILDDDQESKQQADETQNDEKAQEQLEMENWNLSTSQSPLHRLAGAILQQWKDRLTFLDVIENTRVPLVKYTIQTTNDALLSMDVCFNQDSGPKAAGLMKTYLQAMPPLRPLTFILKYFLASRGLNEPYSGGVGSYLLQLLIVSFLQHREREGFNYHRPSPYNLGCLLVEFMELYGLDFNYIVTAISVRYDGYYFPKGGTQKEHFWNPSRPFLLAVESPLEPTMDVGKSSFRIQIVQRSLGVAFKILLAHVTEPRLEAMSILASILPPTPEMHKRRQQGAQNQQMASNETTRPYYERERERKRKRQRTV